MCDGGLDTAVSPILATTKYPPFIPTYAGTPRVSPPSQLSLRLRRVGFNVCHSMSVPVSGCHVAG